MKDIVQTLIIHEIGREDRDAESVDGSQRLAMRGGNLFKMFFHQLKWGIDGH